jgi:hypothetical protein
VAEIAKSLLGVALGIALTVIPLFVIVTKCNHGKEFIVKLDGLKVNSETSYGFENNSHGFLLLARYEDSRYGAVCVDSQTGTRHVESIICDELNIKDTGGFQRRMERGIQRVSKTAVGRLPCKQPPLKQPQGCFKGGHPQ